MTFSSHAAASSSWLDPSEARGSSRGYWSSIRFFIEDAIRGLRSGRSLAYTSHEFTQRTRSVSLKWTLKSFFSVPLGLILLWVFTLWWGEKMTFKRTVADCAWARWENRVCVTLTVNEDKMRTLLTIGTASRSKSTSCHSHRRSPDRGSPYLSWKTLVIDFAHNLPYRRLFTKSFYIHAKPVDARYRSIPG